MAKKLKKPEGFCLSCKEEKRMKNFEKVEMDNGKPAMKGECPDCGTGMYKILPEK